MMYQIRRGIVLIVVDGDTAVEMLTFEMMSGINFQKKWVTLDE